MTILADDIVAFSTWGVFTAPEFPAITDVRLGVGYGDGRFVGTHDCDAESLLPAAGGDANMYISEWGEAIQYKPLGGDVRDILAIVDREPPEDLTGASHGISNLLQIAVNNSVTTGISSGEVDTGGDLVTVAVRKKGTATDRVVTKIVKQDAGMLTLELR